MIPRARLIAPLWVGLGFLSAVWSASLLDPSFRLDHRVEGPIYAMAPQSDGKIVVAGKLSLPDVGPVHVFRLNPDGGLDPSFRPFSILTYVDEDTSMSLLVLPDGRIWVRVSKSNWVGGGGMSTDPIHLRSTIVVASRDGGEPVPWGEVPALIRPTLLPDGKLLLWGTQGWREGTGAFNRAYLELRTLEGQLDSSLRLPAGVTNHYWGELNHVSLCRNGDLLLAGGFPTRSMGSIDWLIRLSPEGELRWRSAPPQYLTPAHYVAEDPSDRIILVGGHPNGIIRYGGDGTPDTQGFHPPAYMNGQPSLLLQDGRLLMFGRFNSVQGLVRPQVVAFAPDGSIDLAFNPGAGFAEGSVIRDVLQQPDGRCLVIGDFSAFDGQPCRGIIRLFNSDPDLKGAPASGYYLQSRLGLAECGGPAVFEVVRAGPLDRTSRVRISTVSSSAVAGDDFVPLDETVTFLPGQRKHVLSLIPLLDQYREPDEVLYLRFSGMDEAIYGPEMLENQVVIQDRVCPVPGDELRVTVTEGSSYRAVLGQGTWREPEDALNARVRVLPGSTAPERDYRITISLISSQNPAVGIEVTTVPNAVADGSRELRLELYDGRTGNTLEGLHLDGYNRAVITILDDEVPAVEPDVLDGPILGFARTKAGSVLAKGTFEQFGHLRRTGLVRLDASGLEDATFDAHLGTFLDARAVVPLQDDRIWVGGLFTQIQGRFRPGVARLLADGTIDDTFVPEGDFYPSLSCPGAVTTMVEGIVVCPDDQIWLWRSWIPGSGCSLSATALQRLEPDGRLLQSTPLPPEASPQLTSLEPLPDGSVLFQAGILGRLDRSGNVSVLATNLTGVSARLTTGEILTVPGYGEPTVWRDLDGTVLRQQDRLEIEGVWYYPIWARGILTQPDGAVVLTGTFSSEPNIGFGAESWIIQLNRDGTVPAGRSCRLPATPNYGAPAMSAAGEWYVAMEGFSETVPRWLRLGSDWKLVRDLRIREVIPGHDGRVYLKLMGQALGGFSLESSEDLMHWRPVYHATGTYVGQVFPDLWPEQVPGARYYRIP